MTVETMSGGYLSPIARYVADYDMLSKLMAVAVRTDFVPAHFRPAAFLPKGVDPTRATDAQKDTAFQTAVASATIGARFGVGLGLGGANDDPFVALSNVYVVSGKPGLYADSMVALVQDRGHEVWTEDLTDARAVVCGRRKGSEHVERVQITLQQAQKAGWTRNQKYRDEPQAMLYARAAARVCRRIAADALKGFGRAAEELEDDELTGSPSNGSRTVQRAPARKALAEAAAAPVTPVRSAPFSDAPAAETRELPPLPGEEEPSGPVRDQSADGVTDAQLRKLGAVFGDLGVKGEGSRAQRLRMSSRAVGRELTTSRDLTKAEAQTLIDTLEGANSATLRDLGREDPPGMGEGLLRPEGRTTPGPQDQYAPAPTGPPLPGEDPWDTSDADPEEDDDEDDTENEDDEAES